MTEKILKQAGEYIHDIPLSVISQGAEAIVFKTNVHPYSSSKTNNGTYIIKYRPRKAYRHPRIDAAITKTRTASEVKFMYKLAKLGLRAPQVVTADFHHGTIWMECVGQDLPDGEISSLKNWFWYLERNKSAGDCLSAEVEEKCKLFGHMIGRLHMNDMIHGDLTSSNVLLDNGMPVLIDFGLSSYSGLPEDKAVDLYVLERAILSTHSVHASHYNGWILDGYKDIHSSREFGSSAPRKLNETLKRLDEVRLRGRKRSMLG